MFPEDTSSQTDQPQPAPLSAAGRPNRKWLVMAIGGGCSLLACAAILTTLIVTLLVPSVTNRVSQQVIATANLVTQQPAANQPANTMGDPSAPVKVIEFADFQCPYCMRFSQQTEPQIVEQYVITGKVFFEYHSVGDFLGEESGAAAQAAYCAGDQGRFWQYHDTLFSHWTGENVGDFANDKLLQYAASLGLDKGLFSDCLNGGKYAARVQQDATDAKSAGVRATPSFLINGKLLEGALPFTDFQKAIEAALQPK